LNYVILKPRHAIIFVGVLIIIAGILGFRLGGEFILKLNEGGIAVLNGQILVNAIRHCVDQGNSIVQSIKVSALSRLQPVLAIAAVDIAGFIPMAISTGVGAEVQRPLATVVIGGLFTSTILTL
jgi:Cu/Ag efflux pump CusA